MVEVVLSEDAAPWTHTDENLAMLIDRLDYWLLSEYGQWTYDPDDPENKLARAERKKSGMKPPPVPILTPVAQRPPRQAAAARELAERMREQYRTPPEAQTQPGESNIDALDRLLGG